MSRLTNHDLRVQFPGMTRAEAVARLKIATQNGRETQARLRAADPPKPPKAVKVKGPDLASRTSRRRAAKLHAPAVNSIFKLGQE